jgi:predicted transposase YbfD/YdcC
LNFSGLRLLARVDSETKSAGQVVARETRYFACSLGPGRISAGGLLKLIRGHWQVENSLHYIKDRWWDEDRHYTKQDRLGEGMTVLRNAAVSILRAAPTFGDGEPIRARADWLARDIDRAIELLTRTLS